MSIWIGNLRRKAESHRTIILHKNVRDHYIDSDGRVYENLTPVLYSLARKLGFREVFSYDAVGGERRLGEAPTEDLADETEEAEDELSKTRPSMEAAGSDAEPHEMIAEWVPRLEGSGEPTFIILHYLDKLVHYKESYSREEQRTLLWLEKVIQKMTARHRLVMIALQDSMVPRELYIEAPNTTVFAVPRPDKEDRLAFLRHCVGSDVDALEQVAELTDGMHLRELEPLVMGLKAKGQEVNKREVVSLVNKYRFGVQRDYWGELSAEKMASALAFFTEQEGIKGQDEAIHKVVNTIFLGRAGLSGIASGTAAKPKGVLLLVGPSGVGKTLVAKKLAKFVFGKEDAYLRYDMSECKDEHTVSKLIGSPSGYVGYEEGGKLTNAVREKPFSVVLFDEIEKAHRRVIDIFLQVLDDGRLTDSRGQTVFFSETMIIFTSNIGTRSVDSAGIPSREHKELEKILTSGGDVQLIRARVREHFVSCVERFFEKEISRPELLNRIGNGIVPFNHIDSEEIQVQIFASNLKRIEEEIREKYRGKGEHSVTFDQSIVPYLVEHYGELVRKFGGRAVTNVIADEVVTPLARHLFGAELDGRALNLICRVASDGKGLRFEG